MPGKIAAAHHTLADWDFEKGAEYRSLASDFYVSSPTSLKLSRGVGTGAWVGAVLCRIPATLVLPQGEVRTWVRRSAGASAPCIFRNQAALGSANWLNCYMIYLGANIAGLYRVLSGVLLQVDSTSCSTFIGSWTHYRFFWYNGKTPGEVPALCVDIYRDIAGEWVKQGSTMYHTLNLWKDSAINRCGFRPVLSPDQAVWYDDTEIWGPV